MTDRRGDMDYLTAADIMRMWPEWEVDDEEGPDGLFHARRRVPGAALSEAEDSHRSLADAIQISEGRLVREWPLGLWSAALPTARQLLAAEFPRPRWSHAKLPGSLPVYSSFYCSEDGTVRRHVVTGSPEEQLAALRSIEAAGGPAKASWLPGSAPAASVIPPEARTTR